MTPDEVALLKHAGEVFVANFSRMVGLYFLPAFLTLHTLLAKTPATWILCTMLAFLFSITTTYLCLYVAISFKLMIGCLIDNIDLELLERFEVADSSNLRLYLALDSAFALQPLPPRSRFIFGDGIVVWRAWAVWSDQQSVIILSALTSMATFGMGLCFLNVLLIYFNY
ncbi:hypothetical protein C8J56DRAFT_939666 [Mycena floridula]|nr:hypothetical protein C8J56DRAFT_939666 [Mycena floridula]